MSLSEKGLRFREALVWGGQIFCLERTRLTRVPTLVVRIPELFGEGSVRMCRNNIKKGGTLMGRGILLWLLGVPLPIIILLALFL